MPLTRSTAIAAGVLACLLGGRAQLLSQERTLVAHGFEAIDARMARVRRHWCRRAAAPRVWRSSRWLHLACRRGAGRDVVLQGARQRAERAVGGRTRDAQLQPQAVGGRRGDLRGRCRHRRRRRAGCPTGFRTSPGTSWTPFSVKLAAGAGWRWNWNTPASQEQIHSVLANPTSLEIRGEWTRFDGRRPKSSRFVDNVKTNCWVPLRCPERHSSMS